MKTIPIKNKNILMPSDHHINFDFVKSLSQPLLLVSLFFTATHVILELNIIRDKSNIIFAALYFSNILHRIINPNIDTLTIM